MFEKLTSLILDSKEKITAHTVNLILWFFLIIVTYSKWIGVIEFNSEKIIPSLLSGSVVLFFAWGICVVIASFILKYLISGMLVNSKFAMKLFLTKIIPVEYRVSALNLYYKKGSLSNSVYLNKIIEFKNHEKINVEEADKTLTLFTDIVLKFILLLICTVNNFSGVGMAILILALISSIIALFLLIVALTTLKGKKIIYGLIQSFVS